jgi:hypothetical protein
MFMGDCQTAQGQNLVEGMAERHRASVRENAFGKPKTQCR